MNTQLRNLLGLSYYHSNGSRLGAFRYDLEQILCHILSCSRIDLFLEDRKLTFTQYQMFNNMYKQRLSGRPLQYILGKTEFMGLEFRVSPLVFIPRPETEILVETALEIIKTSISCHQDLSILDLGTGCGNVAVSIARHLPECKIAAVDVSEDILNVAKQNAGLHNTEGKIEFLRGELFGPLGNRQFEVIVSNPPYIPSRQLPFLSSEVRHEPQVAIDGGEDGLYFYRRIIMNSPQYLKEGGYLIMEMGYNQRRAIWSIVRRSKGTLRVTKVIKDYSGKERVIAIQNLT